MTNILDDLIWVTLDQPDDFLKVRETLSRIGVPSQKEKVLYQSCHILHKQGKYAIVHFKQLFLLDGKRSDFTDEDRGRLNVIANLLSDWKLVKLVDPDKVRSPTVPLSQIKIITYKEKPDWQLVTKYTLGKPKKQTP